MNFKMMTAANNAEGQLFANIAASDMSCLLKAGEGMEYPTGIAGNCDAVGTDTDLHSTGIGASGVAVGDFIRNVTSGETAVIMTVSADIVTTTPLESGIWDDTDEWAVGSFILKLQTKDADGKSILWENVLVKYADNANDALYFEQRGYSNTTPLPWVVDDYASLVWEEEIANGYMDTLAYLMVKHHELVNSLETGDFDFNGDVTFYGQVTFENYAPISNTVSTLDNHLVTRGELADSAFSGGGDPDINTTYMNAIDGGADEREFVYIDKVAVEGSAVYKAGFGQNTTGNKTLEVMVVGTGVQMNSQDFLFAKYNTPTDRIVVTIETDNAGQASGTLADPNAISNNILGGSLTTTLTKKTVNFAGNFTLTKGVKYWYRFDRSGGYDNSNYFAVGVQTGFPSSAFRVWRNTNVPSRISTDWKLYFDNAAGVSDELLSLCDKGDMETVDWLGCVDETKAFGEDTPVRTGGMKNGFTGLDVLSDYYIATAGGIENNLTTNLPYFASAGRAVKDDTLYIKKQPKFAKQIVISETSTGVTSTKTVSVPHNLGRTPEGATAYAIEWHNNRAGSSTPYTLYSTGGINEGGVRTGIPISSVTGNPEKSGGSSMNSFEGGASETRSGGGSYMESVTVDNITFDRTNVNYRVTQTVGSHGGSANYSGRVTIKMTVQ